VSEKRLGAAFFVANADDPGGDLHALASAAGLEAYGSSVQENGREVLYGRWAGIDGTQATVERLDCHRMLHLAFWLSGFFDGLGPREPDVDVPLDDDPVLPRATAFLAAAERLGAEVGILVTHLDQADPGWFRDQYVYVLGMAGAALVNQRSGILYVDERVAEELGDDRLLDDHDVIRGEHGLLIFGGRGATRWF
jgi:hypothetical protein